MAIRDIPYGRCAFPEIIVGFVRIVRDVSGLLKEFNILAFPCITVAEGKKLKQNERSLTYNKTKIST
jgi:hypothetical protein